MANSLAAGGIVGPGPLAGQGPQVDASAMQAPQATPGAPDAGPPKTVTPEELTDTINKQAVIDQKLQGLLAKGGPISRKAVTQMAIEIVAERVMSAQKMAGFLASLPEDPDAVREWVEAHANDAESHLKQMLTMIHGTVDPNTPMPAFGDALNADQHAAVLQAPPPQVQ